MKLLVITDLHQWSDEEKVITENLTGYDICFLLGDISVDKLRTLQRIIKTELYALNGNHDTVNMVEDNGLDGIDNKLIKFKGTLFTGMSGAYKYKEGNYHQLLQEESSAIANKLQKADIFLSHDGPYNGKNDDANCGLKGITEYIKKHQPKLHIYGHMHENKKEEIIHKNKSFFKNLFGPKEKTVSICVYRAAIIDTDTFEIKNVY